MINFGNIRKNIKKALNQVACGLQDDELTRPWTIEIKRVLSRIGRALNFEVCCSGLPKGPKGEVDWGEWLYDMCWLEHGDGKRPWLYKRMVFAMECEWALPVGDKVLPDFQKLVFSTADLRLLIWQNDANQLKNDFELFIDQIRSARGKQCAYLFAGFQKDHGKFQFF